MTKYFIKKTSSFKTSVKRLSKKDFNRTTEIISKIANDEDLEEKHHDHQLTGNLKSYRECHIKPDLLLIYKKQNDLLILTCVDVGSHSELFRK